jgi:hypothetical protein
VKGGEGEDKGGSAGDGWELEELKLVVFLEMNE